jgi:tape measure domain|nr:MAG TPA: tail tape measure protein [Bacteriophage sp.]
MGNALQFGVAFALYNQFSAEAEKIKQSMQGLEGEAHSTFSNIEKSMNEMALGGAALAAGGGILRGLFKAADVRAQFQSYETQFETLLGSAEKASAMMERVKQDAADNPIFGTKSLVAANAAILATGKMTEDASRKMVNNISNVLAGAGKGDAELIRMSANLNGIVGTGKVTMQDMTQFITAGVPIWKLMEDATGKTKAELEKTGVSAEALAMALEHASSEGGMFYKATERAAQTTEGLKAALEDNIEMSLERIGAAIEPITRGFYKLMASIMDVVNTIVSSPIGGVILNLITALGVLLTIMGTLLVLKGGLRFALVKLTAAFGQNTAATLVKTIADKGLLVGMKAITSAMWQTVAPTLILAAKFLVIAAIGYAVWKMIDSGNEKLQILGSTFGIVAGFMFGWVGALVGAFVVLAMWLYKGFTIWNDGMDTALEKGKLDEYVGGLTTLERAFASIFGVIQAVSEIWSSWNGETYELSEDTANKLEALGLSDFVHRLATHIAAFQEFFSGLWTFIEAKVGVFWDTIAPIFDSIWENGLKPLWESLVNNFKPIWDKIFGGSENSDPKGAWEWGFVVGRALGHVFDWFTNILKVLQPVIEFVFQFVADYVVPLIAFWVEVVIWLITAFWDLTGAVADVIIWIGEKIGAFIDWFWEKTAVFREIGIKMFTAFWEGLKTMWTTIKEWVTSITEWIIDKIKSAISGIAEVMTSIGNFFGGDGEATINHTGAVPIGASSASPVFSPITSKTPALGRNFAGVGGANSFSSNPIINVTLDGDRIASSIQQRQEMSNARKN